MPSPELTPADWVNISLTEAMLARDGPPLYVAAKLGCVAAVRVMCEAGTNVELLLAVGADIGIARLDGMTAIHIAQLPGTPKAIYELIMLGQEEL